MSPEKHPLAPHVRHALRRGGALLILSEEEAIQLRELLADEIFELERAVPHAPRLNAFRRIMRKLEALR